MKTRKLNLYNSIVFMAVAVATVVELAIPSLPIFAQRELVLPDSITSNFYKEVKVKSNYWDTVGIEKRKGGFKHFGRWKYFWESRVMQDGSYPPQKLYFEAWKQVENDAKRMKNNNHFLAMPTWKELGPTEDPLGPRTQKGVGRLNTIRINPNNSNEIWVGSASGGAWVSRDGGSNWKVLYQTEFLSLGVSDIALAPSNPRTVYVATGDNDGSMSSTKFYSIGIIKSIDGGETWQQTGYITELANSKIVTKIWVAPDDENTVVAATSSGIIKSIDGGATWEEKGNNYFLADLKQKPDDSNVLYACSMNSGSAGSVTVIMKSTDRGETWSEVRRINDSRRTCLAVTPAAPSKVYALTCNSIGGFLSLLTSNDAGNNWEETNTYYYEGANYLGWAIDGHDGDRGQGWYDLALAVSPTNENNIFIGGVNIWKSTNGGKDFEINAYWSESYEYDIPYVHADVHELVFNNSKLYAAHDGGIDITTNLGASWQSLNKGLGISQIYKFSNSKQNPSDIIIGLQDLGTRIFRDNNWSYVGGGDGMDCEFDPKDDNRMYYSIYYGTFRRIYNDDERTIISPRIVSQRFGVADSGAWVTPMAISKINPNKIYVGYSNIYYSEDYGESWDKLTNYGSSSAATFRSLEISEVDDNYIYAATLTNFSFSSDGGRSWRNINNPSANGSNISSITIHPNDPTVAYVTYSGFKEGIKLFKYDGNSWTNLSENLPNVPANCVALQYNNGLHIYVGTDIGVYYCAGEVPYYKKWGNGLPNLYISQLEIVPSLNKIRAASYGRGVWEIDLNTCPIEYFDIASAGELEFCVGDSVLLHVETPNTNDIIWSTGETGNEIWAKTAGTYWAVSNANSDCNKVSNIINVTTKTTKILDIYVETPTDICVGDSVLLTASGGFLADSYEWNDGTKNRTFIAKEAGEYFVTATSENGCKSISKPITVRIFDYPEKPGQIISLIEGYPNEANEIYDTLVATVGNKFIWYKNGERINGATSQKYAILRDAENTADYTVAIAMDANCYSEPSEAFSYTDINETISSFWNVKPNPAKNNFTIELSENYSNYYTISLLNLQGIEVLRQNNVYISGNFTVDISNIEIGTYILKLSSSKHTFTKKIIKE